jgi:hypothetical protein
LATQRFHTNEELTVTVRQVPKCGWQLFEVMQLCM